MGYMHIENLYRPEAQAILLFKHVYALEKIHGTSAHIAWKDSAITYFSGGEKHESFKTLFNEPQLIESFMAMGNSEMVVFGEAYGGKCQGMSKTYGKQLKFIVFDVKVGETWLSVDNALNVATKLGLEFVEFKLVSTEIEILNAERDADSTQAVRNGCGGGHIREGVVLRPPVEMTLSNGKRVMAKHKRAEFSERKTIPEVDPAQLEIMTKADDIASEWVTDMRLAHVLDHLGNPSSHKDIPTVIAAMIEDVTREASGEILDNKHVRKAIGARAVKLYKAKIEKI